jgi:hypothetical protein
MTIFDWGAEIIGRDDYPDPDALFVRACAICGASFTSSLHGNQQKRCSACARKDVRKGDRHKTSNDRHVTRSASLRPFIGIDGEGGGKNEAGQQNYLLMCAAGIEGKASILFDNNMRLTTVDCLEFVLALPPTKAAIIVGFFFDYDVTQILRDVPKDRIHRLLKEDGQAGPNVSPYTWWKDYGIEYLPKHYFRVCRVERNQNGKIGTVPGTARTINEAGTFFQMPFAKLIHQWELTDAATTAMIERFKSERPEFDCITPNIKRYCEVECR